MANLCNKMLMSICIVFCLFLGTPVFATTANFQGLGYLPVGCEIIDLGTLNGSSSYAFAINNLGQVAGHSGNYAYFWDSQQGMISLGTLSGGYSKGYGINDEGQIVGNSGSATIGWRAFIWDSIHGMRGIIGAHGAQDINNKGQVVGGATGWAWTAAYIWDKIHGITILGTFGGYNSYAYGVNNNGQVVGRYDGYTAFFWDPNDGMTPLGEGAGHAMSINDAGDVVGWVGRNQHAFIWNKDEGMTNLMTLGGQLSQANGLNNRGEVVGWSHTLVGSHAFYWSKTTGMIDLNLLLAENTEWNYLKDATAINDNGQIVGQGVTKTGQTHAFLMTVIYGEPPIADAGPNQTVYAWIDGIAEVELDGSDSNDPDGDELTYKWTWTIDDNTYEANGVNPIIELPVGVHTIELIVNDGLADSEPNYVDVNVIAPLETSLQIMPTIINRASNIRNIIAVMDMPKGIKRGDVSKEPFVLFPADGEEGIEAVRQYVLPCWRNRVRVFVLFDKDDLTDLIPDNGRAKLQVVGELNSGQYIFGEDDIWLIGKRRPLWPWCWPKW